MLAENQHFRTSKSLLLIMVLTIVNTHKAPLFCVLCAENPKDIEETNIINQHLAIPTRALQNSCKGKDKERKTMAIGQPECAERKKSAQGFSPMYLQIFFLSWRIGAAHVKIIFHPQEESRFISITSKLGQCN